MSVKGNGGPLVLAVPSKGRLQENASAFFARAGLLIEQPGGARNYRGRLAGLPDVEVAFLSASEIVKELATGTVHLGVTGEDLVRETVPDADARLELITPLGFGHATVVVAVPQAWIDVRTMADLDDVASIFRHRHGRSLRVATKYVNLTRAFFARHGIIDYRIVESLGATEGAPASGAAELIVDITTTGATLAANELKVIEDGIILRSEANLVASLVTGWPETARAALAAILDRVAAEEAARTTREIRAVVTDAGVAVEVQERFGARLPFGAAEGLLVIHCPLAEAAACAAFLKARGAETVTVARLEYVFSAGNPLLERLLKRLG